MRVYIAGPVTGMRNFNREAFDEAEAMLNAKGYEAVNPLRYTEYRPERTWREYMVADIGLLLSCHGVHMLEGWEKSKGASLEHTIATELGYEFV